MADEPTISYTPASNVILRWLTDPGTQVPQHIRDVLLAELFSSPNAVLAGIFAVLMVNIIAVLLHGSRLFYFVLPADLVISALRIMVVRRVLAALRTAGNTPTDFYLITGVLWCILQGIIAFMALRSHIPTLQILAAATAMSLIGPICARNYPAPRFAMVLCCLTFLPFVAGAATSGDPWLLVTLLMTPTYLYGSYTTIARFQEMSVQTLQSRHESQILARHDPLTGLVNRAGLMEALSVRMNGKGPRMTLFYLDLDGFKQINDNFGHMVGDLLLQEVAARLKTGVGAEDIAARMGGDEFVVISPDMKPAEAEVFATQLIRLVQAPYDLSGIGTLRVGVSVGFACAPEDSASLAELYRLADAALYHVKGAAKGTQRRAGPILNSAA